MNYEHVTVSTINHNNIWTMSRDEEIKYYDFIWNDKLYIMDPWQKHAEQVLYKTFRLNFIENLLKIKTTDEIYFYRINENDFYFDGKPAFYVYLDTTISTPFSNIYQFKFSGNCTGYRVDGY